MEDEVAEAAVALEEATAEAVAAEG